MPGVLIAEPTTMPVAVGADRLLRQAAHPDPFLVKAQPAEELAEEPLTMPVAVGAPRLLRAAALPDPFLLQAQAAVEPLTMPVAVGAEARRGPTAWADLGSPPPREEETPRAPPPTTPRPPPPARAEPKPGGSTKRLCGVGRGSGPRPSPSRWPSASSPSSCRWF